MIVSAARANFNLDRQFKTHFFRSLGSVPTLIPIFPTVTVESRMKKNNEEGL